MELREATINDWPILQRFYEKIYRVSHPLHIKSFWEWQYGDPQFGRSFVCIDNDRVVGHVGANFGGDISWIINVYLEEEYRGKGILTKLYDLARTYFPLAATAANEAGLGLYRNMRWIRYYDLVRYVKINPNKSTRDIIDVCCSVDVDVDKFLNKNNHYFQQPGIVGISVNQFNAVSQPKVGGLRLVDFDEISDVEEAAWELGFNWIDYISSWNDQRHKQLEKNGWLIDSKSIVPWRLDPIQPNYFCDITFLSEKSLPNNFIVHRSFSDHGRIGSLKLEDF